MLLRVRLALGDRREVHPQQVPAVAGREVAADAFADFDLDAELLAAFAAQCLGLGLVRFDLAARELPQSGELGRVGAGGGEDAVLGADRGADDDARFVHRTSVSAGGPASGPTTVAGLRAFRYLSRATSRTVITTEQRVAHTFG